MFDLLRIVLVASGMVWLAGVVAVQLVALRVARSEDPATLSWSERLIEKLGTRWFMPAAVALLASGLGVASQAFGYVPSWVLAASVLWLVSAVAAAAYLGERTREATALVESEGPDSAAAHALTPRIMRVSRAELLALAVVVALVVPAQLV